MDRGSSGAVLRIVVLKRSLLLLAVLWLAVDWRPPTAQAGARQQFLPVLIYHHVKWLKPSDNQIERGLTVLPTAFAEQLSYLQRNGYHLVTAFSIVDQLHAGRALPARSIALTFDDGYADVYRGVYKILRARRLTATFFIVPGFLGHARYLSWSQVQDMQTHGMDIEAHTMTHPDLRLVKSAQQWSEILGSRQVLGRRLRKPVRVFAYPYGGYNDSIVSQVARAGYWGAFTTREGWFQSRDQILVLPRVYVDLDDSLSVFAGRVKADPGTLALDPY